MIDLKNVTKVLGAVLTRPELAPLVAEARALGERVLATALPLVEAEAVRMAGEAFGEGPGDVDIPEVFRAAAAANDNGTPPHRMPETCVQCGSAKVETESSPRARRFCVDCGRIQPRGTTS